jgi:hypothetical protein
MVFRLGCGAVVLGQLDGLWWLGCGQVGFLSLFCFFLFYFFQLSNLNSNLLAGF